MFDRLKQALVESYVGAIVLGYLFAQGILHFVDIFTTPVAGWISRKQYGGWCQARILCRASRSRMHCLSWSDLFCSCWSGTCCCAGSTSSPSKKRYASRCRAQSKLRNRRENSERPHYQRPTRVSVLPP
jgi:hypothetical protein